MAHLQQIANQMSYLSDLLDGLQCKPFRWSPAGKSAIQWLKAAGWTLMTHEQLTDAGYKLKRGVDPVGVIYMSAPFANPEDLYVIEFQAYREDDDDKN